MPGSRFRGSAGAVQQAQRDVGHGLRQDSHSLPGGGNFRLTASQRGPIPDPLQQRKQHAVPEQGMHQTRGTEKGEIH